MVAAIQAHRRDGAPRGVPTLPITIDRCHDPSLWDRVGQEANADRSEYARDAVAWPPYAAPENGASDFSAVASLDGRPVGRVQRRAETLLEVAVARDARRHGV